LRRASIRYAAVMGLFGLSGAELTLSLPFSIAAKQRRAL